MGGVSIISGTSWCEVRREPFPTSTNSTLISIPFVIIIYHIFLFLSSAISLLPCILRCNLELGMSNIVETYNLSLVKSTFIPNRILSLKHFTSSMDVFSFSCGLTPI